MKTPNEIVIIEITQDDLRNLVNLLLHSDLPYYGLDEFFEKLPKPNDVNDEGGKVIKFRPRNSSK